LFLNRLVEVDGFKKASVPPYEFLQANQVFDSRPGVGLQRRNVDRAKRRFFTHTRFSAVAERHVRLL
jgi:hypothetical protein